MKKPSTPSERWLCIVLHSHEKPKISYEDMLKKYTTDLRMSFSDRKDFVVRARDPATLSHNKRHRWVGRNIAVAGCVLLDRPDLKRIAQGFMHNISQRNRFLKANPPQRSGFRTAVRLAVADRLELSRYATHPPNCHCMYEDCPNYCFAGDVRLLLASGQLLPVRDLRPGMSVASFADGRMCAARVEVVTADPTEGLASTSPGCFHARLGHVELALLSNGVRVTPGHPVNAADNSQQSGSAEGCFRWVQPRHCPSMRKLSFPTTHVPAIYNLVFTRCSLALPFPAHVRLGS
jgi:hypothetical protein